MVRVPEPHAAGLMQNSAWPNPTPTSRRASPIPRWATCSTRKKEEASAEAKSLVKLFSTDAVSEMLASNGGLGESEAKAIASTFSVETSKVPFDQRPQFETPAPETAALLEPFPLSEKHAGTSQHRAGSPTRRSSAWWRRWR